MDLSAQKKKRGRPRKYALPSIHVLSHSPDSDSPPPGFSKIINFSTGEISVSGEKLKVAAEKRKRTVSIDTLLKLDSKRQKGQENPNLNPPEKEVVQTSADVVVISESNPRDSIVKPTGHLQYCRKPKVARPEFLKEVKEEVLTGFIRDGIDQFVGVSRGEAAKQNKSILEKFVSGYLHILSQYELDDKERSSELQKRITSLEYSVRSWSAMFNSMKKRADELQERENKWKQEKESLEAAKEALNAANKILTHERDSARTERTTAQVTLDSTQAAKTQLIVEKEALETDLVSTMAHLSEVERAQELEGAKMEELIDKCKNLEDKLLAAESEAMTGFEDGYQACYKRLELAGFNLQGHSLDDFLAEVKRVAEAAAKQAEAGVKMVAENAAKQVETNVAENLEVQARGTEGATGDAPVVVQAEGPSPSCP